MQCKVVLHRFTSGLRSEPCFTRLHGAKSDARRQPITQVQEALT